MENRQHVESIGDNVRSCSFKNHSFSVLLIFFKKHHVLQPDYTSIVRSKVKIGKNQRQK